MTQSVTQVSQSATTVTKLDATTIRGRHHSIGNMELQRKINVEDIINLT